jgi:hypothetical protein
MAKIISPSDKLPVGENFPQRGFTLDLAVR